MKQRIPIHHWCPFFYRVFNALCFKFVCLFYFSVIKNIGKPQSRLCATRRFNRKKNILLIVENKIVFTHIYSRKILLMSCKNYITNEEQIIIVGEIQNMNSGRTYNQGINSDYCWVKIICIFTSFLLAAISNLKKMVYAAFVKRINVWF